MAAGNEVRQPHFFIQSNFIITVLKTVKENRVWKLAACPRTEIGIYRFQTIPSLRGGQVPPSSGNIIG